MVLSTERATMTPFFFGSVDAETATRIEERAGAVAARCEVIHHLNGPLLPEALTCDPNCE
jgi:hypothetical protein